MRFEIQVAQSGHCWTIDIAHTQNEAEILREHYHSSGHYDRVEVVDILEIRG